jgi:hypothetical protein
MLGHSQLEQVCVPADRPDRLLVVDCKSFSTPGRLVCYFGEMLEYVVVKANSAGVAIDRMKLTDQLSGLHENLIAVRRQKRAFLSLIQQPQLQRQPARDSLAALRRAIQALGPKVDAVEVAVVKQPGDVFLNARRSLAEFEKAWVDNVNLGGLMADPLQRNRAIQEGQDAIRGIDSLSVALANAIQALNK